MDHRRPPRRPTAVPAPLALATLSLLAAALGACGGSLYDASGVPPLPGPGPSCDPPQHVCADACVDQSVAACGDACQACTTSFPDATATCEAGAGAGGGHGCAYTCAAGLFKCPSGCCRAVAVASGASHACAVTSDGSLLCWGANGAGQLGRTGEGSPRPSEVLASGVTAVAAGARHTCAVQAGLVWCWGANDKGQLGVGSTGAGGPTPVSTGLSGAGGLAAGADHTCALVAAGGEVRCWGANDQGQVGTGTTSQAVAAPAPPALSGASQLGASPAGATTCALVAGQARCWGANGSGQAGACGGGGACPSAVAAPITVPLPAAAAFVAVGGFHACAGVPGLGLHCWGRNEVGQVGTGSPSGTPTYLPAQASRLDNGQRAVAAAAGAAHTCAIKAGDVAMKCGGRNDQQQAGAPAPDPALEGLDVSLGGALVAAAAGADHTCALVDEAGKLAVRCWGRNAEGQLGRDTGGLPSGTADYAGR